MGSVPVRFRGRRGISTCFWQAPGSARRPCGRYCFGVCLWNREVWGGSQRAIFFGQGGYAGMLVLQRREDEGIVLIVDGRVLAEIAVAETKRRAVRLRVSAPKEVKILRSELREDRVDGRHVA
ncbi:MAG: carbon storage regulator [Planctomycetota bacterium]|nr:MAG: carbon storage regulator [Planctomycetota bacterium]